MRQLITERLIIRSLEPDDHGRYADLMRQCFDPDYPEDDQRAITEYLIAAERGRELMHQPPYGDRAVVLAETGELIGSVGLVPSMIPDDENLMHPEMGMFWAMHPAHRRCGYTKEAATELMRFAFEEQNVWRLIATTEADNHASQGVMRSLNMRLERYDHVPWWQVLGTVNNPHITS